MTGKVNHCTAASSADHTPGGDLLGEEDDFDALLAASSFGSEQALAIREQMPATAREHARRVLDGEEKCAPVEGDVDDAVSGLVYGLAHGVVPSDTVAVFDGSDKAADLFSAWEGVVSTCADFRPAAVNVAIVAACQTSMLWPDHRAHLLQALIDHDAFTELRPDVALNIVNWTFSLNRPPRVLLQCASLAIDQIDVASLAYTRFSDAWDETARRFRRSYQLGRDHDTGRYDPRFPEDRAERKEVQWPESFGALEPAKPALNSTPAAARLAAPIARTAVTAQTDPGPEPSAAKAQIVIRAGGKCAGRAELGTLTWQPAQRECRHRRTVGAKIVLVMLGASPVIERLFSAGSSAIVVIGAGMAVIGLGVTLLGATLWGGPAQSERAFRIMRKVANRAEPAVPDPPAHSDPSGD